MGRPAALAASTAPATPPPMLILPPVAGAVNDFFTMYIFYNTWHSNVGVAEGALLHVLEVSDSSLDLMDNILQALLLSRMGRDSCRQHRDSRGQR